MRILCQKKFLSQNQAIRLLQFAINYCPIVLSDQINNTALVLRNLDDFIIQLHTIGYQHLLLRTASIDCAFLGLKVHSVFVEKSNSDNIKIQIFIAVNTETRIIFILDCYHIVDFSN